MQVAWGGAAGAYDDGGRDGGGHDLERRCADRRRRHFVTMMQNARSVSRPAAGAVGPRAVGPRPRIAGDGAAHRHRRHVRRPVHRRVSRLRRRARRLRLHARRAAAGNGGAGHLRRQRAERGLRPARRLSDPAARCAALRLERSGLCRRRCAHPRRRLARSPASPTRRGSWSRAPDLRGSPPRSRRRSSTGTCRAAAPPRLHGLRAVGRAAAGGDDRRHDDQRGHRPRLPDPRRPSTIATAPRSRRCWR